MKRNVLSVIALTLCVLMTVLCLAACGGSGDSNSDAQSALIGTWNANEAENAAYVFAEDGVGKWVLSDEGIEMNFNYTDNGTSVEIIYEGASEGMIWNYTIDGSLLTMTDTDTGTVLTYSHA